MDKQSRFAKKLREAGFIDGIDCDGMCFDKSVV